MNKLNYYEVYCPYHKATVLIESTYSLIGIKRLISDYMRRLKTILNSSFEDRQFTVEKFVDRLSDDYLGITTLSQKSKSDPLLDIYTIKTTQ